MSVKLSITPEGLDPGDLDRLTREVEHELIATGGVGLETTPTVAEAGQRGDPITVTLGTLILATVTSGTVKVVFELLKSYIDRGVDFTFEGKNAGGDPVKVAMKNVKLSQFRSLLTEVGILK